MKINCQYPFLNFNRDIIINEKTEIYQFGIKCQPLKDKNGNFIKWIKTGYINAKHFYYYTSASNIRSIKSMFRKSKKKIQIHKEKIFEKSFSAINWNFSLL